MTIKDVEKLTGLTAKSIRYYESKELIQVEREEKNSYRNYSEKEVNQLKWIKLLRYLEFSIEEIRQIIQSEEEQIKEAMRKKADSFSEQKEVCTDKQKMCLNLAKEYKEDPAVIEEYNEGIEFLESDEWTEIKEELLDWQSSKLFSNIRSTLIYLAPIIWLFYNIHTQKQDLLLMNAIFAIIGTIGLTLIWSGYIRFYRENKQRVKRNNKEWLTRLPFKSILVVLGIVFVILLCVGIEYAVHWIGPKNYIFFEFQGAASSRLALITVVPVIVICALLYEKRAERTRKKEPVYLEIWRKSGKKKWLLVILWIFGIYYTIMNVAFVTEDSIVTYSWLNPKGTTYKYADVEHINTGFGKKLTRLIESERKGEFFYKIQLDGKTITFHTPDVNSSLERYQPYDATYLELEDFDKALVSLNIPKESSKEGYEYCDLDKVYVDRFLRIIELR